MSRNTITIHTPNGAKVRTVFSKRYFVVHEDRSNYLGYDFVTKQSVYSNEYKVTAKVYKRTDSAVAALAELRRNPVGTAVYVATLVDDKPVVRMLDLATVTVRATGEKRSKQFQARRGNQGEARRLNY